MLYAELEKLGHRPWFICRRGFALEEYAQREGLRFLSLDFGSRFNPLRDAADLRRWRAWVRAERPSILHCHRGKDHWLGAAVSLFERVPLVRTRHVVTPVRRHLFNRWLYFRATRAVLHVSEAVRRGFGPGSGRLPRERVLLSAVDHRRFTPVLRDSGWRRRNATALCAEPDANEPLWFGLIGRFHNIKGHKYFMQAAAQIAGEFPHAHFLMAGAGGTQKKQDFRAQAAAAGFADRLVIGDFLEDLPRVLASLDVGVIASVGSEGSSRIGLEMMASGLPLVATNVGGIPDIALPSGGGLLAEPRDSEGLAAAMRVWARDPLHRQQAGQANRKHVVKNHDPRQWAQAILEFYS